MNLYNKYRPQSIEDLRGNESLKKSLTNILNRKDKPHAFLITGQSGCGKTTVARIIAKSLNCHETDFNEYDGASDRGIDAMRKLRQEMRYAPMSSECKVYFMEEAHQLTKDAQEALLKALEDTPDHVYFILATTEPEKFKDTFKNRFVEFSVSPLDDDVMFGLLDELAYNETKSELPEQVIDKIVEQAQGSSRDAIQRLEKIIDLEHNEMLDALNESVVEYKEVIELCRALSKPNTKWTTVTKILKGLKDDPEKVRRAVIGYCNSVLLGKDDVHIFLVMDAFREEFNGLGKPALTMACYQAINEVRNN